MMWSAKPATSSKGGRAFVKSILTMAPVASRGIRLHLVRMRSAKMKPHRLLRSDMHIFA
jgi:hypothetical protein